MEMKSICGTVTLVIERTVSFEVKVPDTVTEDEIERAIRDTVDFDPANPDVLGDYSVLIELGKEVDLDGFPYNVIDGLDEWFDNGDDMVISVDVDFDENDDEEGE